MYIDISTEIKRKKVFDLLTSFNTKGEIFKYYGVSDGSSNTKYLNTILNELCIPNDYYQQKRSVKRNCLNCGKALKRGQHKFCCSSCSASYNNKNRKHSEETKNKIRDSILLSIGITNIEDYKDAHNKRVCEYCGKTFINNKHSQKFCCRECARKYRRQQEIKNKNEKDIYKSQTKFNFSLNSYPNEFDFSLIKERGWYKASNHGNNLKGISRDHMFSVDEGYKQGIDPYLISHPANCKLMRHEDNFKKKTGCSITLDELKERIIAWNKKYGEYPNRINYFGIENFKKIDNQ